MLYLGFHFLKKLKAVFNRMERPRGSVDKKPRENSVTNAVVPVKREREEREFSPIRTVLEGKEQSSARFVRK
jgi:hypothetical protein